MSSAAKALKTLVMVPTYNERDNAPRMVESIMALGLDADVLFIDDNSPDGTGALLDAMCADHPRLSVRHRSGKTESAVRISMVSPPRTTVATSDS